jgi:hypothetical protein
LSSLGNINRQKSHFSGVWGGWPVKVNNMCSYPGFKAISGERAHGDGRFSVNFGPMKLIFGPVERGEQGLSNELLVLVLLGVPNIQGPIMGQICFFFFERRKTRRMIEKGIPSLTGHRSQPRSIARPTYLPLD